MISKNETISIGWCDNGMTDGKFTQGLLYTVFAAQQENIKVVGFGRAAGNQIARQRQTVFDGWADGATTDWLLWVDSDVVLTIDILKKLMSTADKFTRPVMCGIYFVSKSPEGELIAPLPVIFNEEIGRAHV